MSSNAPVAVSTLTTADGRTLQYYDVPPDAGDAFPVMYHHGTPNVGEPPVPLFEAARQRGLRWIGYDRPGYGGSDPHHGRTVNSAAADAAAVADALGLGRFAVLGHSGGGPHALACAALLPERVSAAVSISGLAPRPALGAGWFEGMAAPGLAELRAAVQGGDALRAHLESADFDPEMFTPEDLEALETDWSWLDDVAARGTEHGIGAAADDDLAYVLDWGFDVAQIQVPVLVIQGSEDRIAPRGHGEWLAHHIPHASLTLQAGGGHLTPLRLGPEALDWIVQRAPLGHIVSRES